MAITTLMEGGLGNQLFQYIAGRALAKHLSADLIIDRSKLDRAPTISYRPPITIKTYAKEVCQSMADLSSPHYVKRIYRSLFNLTPSYTERPYGLHHFSLKIDGVISDLHWEKKKFDNIYREPKNFAFDKNFFSLADGVTLGGDWHNPTYWQSIKDEWLDSIKPKTPLSPFIKNMIKSMTKNNSVMVHVRRGDYVGWRNWALNITYYKNAFAIIRKKISQPHFFVFSDELDAVIPWLKGNGCLLPTDHIYICPDDDRAPDWQQWLAMGYCKNAIIANSSFSILAAYGLSLRYPSSLVIAPGGVVMSHNLTEEMFLPQWQVIATR